MNKKLVITHKEVNVTPITLFVNIYGWSDKWLTEKVGISDFGLTASKVSGYNLDFFSEPNDKYFKANKIVGQKVLKGQLPIEESIRESIKIGNKLQKLVISEYRHIDQISNKKTTQLFSQVFKLSSQLCALGYIAVLTDWPDEFISPRMDKILGEKLINERQSKISKIKLLLSSPSEKRPLIISREEFLKAIIKKQNLNKWIDKWFWINFGHIGEILTYQDFQKEIKKLANNPRLAIKQLEKIENHYSTLKNKQQKLLIKLKMNVQERKIFEYAQGISYIKAYRTDILALVYAFFDRAFEVYAQKLNINKEVFRFSTKDEIVGYLLGKKTIDKKILERKNYSIWVFDNKQKTLKVLIGDKAKKFEESFIEKEQENKNSDILQGNAAFLGKVTGRVKIVNNTSELNKVEEGDVLVSIQTTPELLPAMKRASAFVTEVGGITSHAAIVAREMRKPCIVGTKVAAQILRDNDLIQVDANHGLVRILQRA